MCLFLPVLSLGKIEATLMSISKIIDEVDIRKAMFSLLVDRTPREAEKSAVMETRKA